MSAVTKSRQRTAYFQLPTPHPRELDARRLPPLKVGTKLISKYRVILSDEEDCGTAMRQALLVTSKTGMPLLVLSDIDYGLKQLSKTYGSADQQYLRLNIAVRAPDYPCNPNKIPTTTKPAAAVRSKIKRTMTTKPAAASRTKIRRTTTLKPMTPKHRSIRMKKYANRKSPLESATLYPVGTTKTGLNGRLWTVAAASNGVRRWKPFAG